MPRGSKPGERRGGRRKGTKNKKTEELKTLVKNLAAEGVTPLEIITTTMRDLWEDANRGPTPNIGKRMQAVMLAEKAAPYLHPRLASTQVTGKDGKDLIPQSGVLMVPGSVESSDWEAAVAKQQAELKSKK